MKLFNKKGVSPLIATVLLIAFAVALGVVVMNWGKDYVETTAKTTSEKADQDLSCQMDIDIGIKEIGSRKVICYDSTEDYLEVMIENTGRATVDGIRFVLIDENDKIVEEDNTTFSINSGSVSSKYLYNYSADNLSTLQYVEIIPMVIPRGKLTGEPCIQNAIKIESIGAC